jgi:hypothetical protein
VWAKFDVVSAGTAHRLVDKFENNQRTYALYGYHDGSKYVIEGSISETGANSNNFVVTSPSGISAGVFYHIVLVKSGTNLRLYIDNVNVATNSSAPTSVYSNTQSLAIGVISFTASQYFDGTLDEIGMWSRGISGAEVTKLYSLGNGLQYPFTEIFTTTETLSLLETVGVNKAFPFTINETLSLTETWSSLRNLISNILENLALKEYLNISKWANQNKTSDTWSGESKPTTTFTKQSKSPSTWTEQNK